MDEREVIEMAQREMETRGLGPRQFHAGQDDLRQRVEALEKAMDDLGRPKGFPRVSTLLDEEGMKVRQAAARKLAEEIPCGHVRQLNERDETVAMLRDMLSQARAALHDILDASDRCQGHRGCDHDMEPWQRARGILLSKVPT